MIDKLIRSILTALITIFFSGTSLLAQEAPGPPAQAVGKASFVGLWAGARLQCRKEETGPVRCGTPSPFQMQLRADGTGTAQGKDFPREFTYESSEEDKLIITAINGSVRLELFSLKVEDDFLSFQAYSGVNPEEGIGREYTHYIYDLTTVSEEELREIKPPDEEDSKAVP